MIDTTNHGQQSPLELNEATTHVNLSMTELVEAALRRNEGSLSSGGALIVETGRFTGRSPKDRFVVRDDTTETSVHWGDVNQPMTAEQFEALEADFRAALADKELFVQDLLVGADERYRLPVRIVTEQAWHNLFAQHLFILPAERPERPAFTVIDLPSLRADPERHGTRTDTVIAVNLTKRLVLIGNTRYGGEIKKSIFSAMNFELPDQGVLPMHCSANHDDDGRVALFFGLSGTGKTTLSADPDRTLIGDDEHGWSERGVFNFEGGCYAKAIKLDPEREPEIYATTQRFGTLLENVVFDPERRTVDFDDVSKTENTRVAYPLEFIPNASSTGVAGHPSAVVFLTADAFGVLPPISKLTPDGAMYHFLSGYTAKLAGTERGVTEPKATFSACFGAPFMLRHPSVYAKMLGEKLETHGSSVWLVNTGWTGGAYGDGKRMDLPYTRAMVKAALSGALDDVPTTTHPVFRLEMPQSCPGVPSELLDPRNTWRDPNAYDAQARKLADMFRENFRKFQDDVPERVVEAGPRS